VSRYPDRTGSYTIARHRSVPGTEHEVPSDQLEDFASEAHRRDGERFAQQRAEIRRQIRDVERAAVSLSMAMASQPKAVSHNARHRLRGVIGSLRKLLDELA
jgi:uncharacterized membrane protein YccC